MRKVALTINVIESVWSGGNRSHVAQLL